MKLLSLILMTLAPAAHAETPLADQLADLGEGVSQDPLYVVQKPESGLGGTFEAGVGGGRQFNPNVYVDSNERGGYVAYHWNDRFFSTLAGSEVFNQMTSSAEKLWHENHVFPDVGFVRKRADMTLGFNVIYGKARVTRDSVFYFNQYVAIGPGLVEQTNGIETRTDNAAVGDAGIACWFGSRLALRMGVKAYNFQQLRVTTSERRTDLVGYATLGMLMGGAG